MNEPRESFDFLLQQVRKFAEDKGYEKVEIVFSCQEGNLNIALYMPKKKHEPMSFRDGEIYYGK